MIVVATITLALNVRQSIREQETDDSYDGVQRFLEQVAAGLPASCAELREVADAYHVATVVTPITGSFWPDFKRQHAEERKFFKVDKSFLHRSVPHVWSKSRNVMLPEQAGEVKS